MSFIVKSVYSRPSTTAEWHNPIILNERIQGLYGAKRVILDTRPTDNTLEIDVLWDTVEDYQAFLAEPEIAEQYELLGEYHESVGIELVSREITEIQ